MRTENVTYNMAIANYKQDVANALNVPVVDDWDVYDEDPQRHLVLVHTHPDADLVKYGWIKGIVLDTRTWKVVCQSYGNSTQVSLSMTRSLEPVKTLVRKDNSMQVASVFRFQSLEGQQLELNDMCIRWVEGFDGTLVRVWKHDGEVYVSSHRRIHTDRASWGGSPPFKEIYVSLGGPTEALFGDAPSSRHVYSFLIVHPALQIGSHVPLDESFLLYLEEHVIPGDTPLTPLPSVLGTIRRPRELSLTAVNYALMYGHYRPEESPHLKKDPRTSHGEFVMCFEYTDASKTCISRCIKVQSDAYTWRVAMRDNDANLEHLVFTVAGIKKRDLRRRPDFYEFGNRYPYIDLPTHEEIPYIVPRFVPQTEVGTKQRQIAVGSLVYAMHPTVQADILRHFATYLIALEEIRAWILRLTVAPPERFMAIEASGPNGKYVAGRIRNILQVSQGRASKCVVDDEKRKELENSVRYLVEHEYGESLYKMYRIYKRLDGGRE